MLCIGCKHTGCAALLHIYHRQLWISAPLRAELRHSQTLIGQSKFGYEFLVTYKCKSKSKYEFLINVSLLLSRISFANVGYHIYDPTKAPTYTVFHGQVAIVAYIYYIYHSSYFVVTSSLSPCNKEEAQGYLNDNLPCFAPLLLDIKLPWPGLAFHCICFACECARFSACFSGCV